MAISTTAALIGMGLMAGGSAAAGIYSAKSGASAARDAAAAQAAASDRALDFQRQQWLQERADMQPWLQAGRGALAQLASGLEPGGDLLRTYDVTFDGQQYAFDPSAVQMDPGFQFRLQEGQKAIERSAAARGTALGGGTLKALARYAQDYASNEYQNAYARALAENQMRYNRALGEFQQAYDIWNQQQANRFNRLAALSGIGQTAATTLGSAGASFANAAAQNVIGQGNAQSAGIIGAQNAINAGIGTAATAPYNALTLWALLKGAGAFKNPAAGVN